MSKAEDKALEAWNNYKLREHPMYRQSYIDGYKQAEKDLMEKAEKWFMEHANIAQEVETDENGEPLADSYIKYAKARIEAAKEMFESFKQAMR